MKITRFNFGLLALAYVALSLQFLVPHHHHQQATFLFLDTCPTAHAIPSDPVHDDHDDGECHHPHSENSECSSLDHVVAAQKKQDIYAGGVDWNTPPLLPLLYVANLFVPTSQVECTAVNGPPLLYEYINVAAHSLRGPPPFA